MVPEEDLCVSGSACGFYGPFDLEVSSSPFFTGFCPVFLGEDVCARHICFDCARASTTLCFFGLVRVVYVKVK